MAKTIPKYVTDLLMHVKDTNGKETVILPITRYDNVLNAPKVLDKGASVMEMTGHPFVLLKTDTCEITTEELRTFVGEIL